MNQITDLAAEYSAAELGSALVLYWYVFWDHVHPTTKAHAVFAKAAAEELIRYYSPRQGKQLPPACLNSLNGLVNAWENN